jgi:hypothetical protein
MSVVTRLMCIRFFVAFGSGTACGASGGAVPCRSTGTAKDLWDCRRW